MNTNFTTDPGGKILATIRAKTPIFGGVEMFV